MVELRDDVEQLEAKLAPQAGGASQATLAAQLHTADKARQTAERTLARTTREHAATLEQSRQRIHELEAMLEMATGEVKRLQDSGAGGGWGLSRDGGSAGREQGDGYAYGVDDIESGSSASESGDSYISASSGTASNARWRAWPAAGSFTSIVSARQRVSSADPAKQRPPAARPKPPT